MEVVQLLHASTLQRTVIKFVIINICSRSHRSRYEWTNKWM